MDLALHPEQADELVAEYVRHSETAYANPGIAQLFARFDALADDDPEPAELDAIAREVLATISDQVEELGGSRSAPSVRTQRLVADWAMNLPPAQRRLMERVAELAQLDRPERGQ